MTPFHYELVEEGDEDGSIVFGEIYDEDHAAAIVRAVNCHDEMLGVLKALMIVIPQETKSYIQGHIDAAEKIIAKAGAA